MGKRLGQLKAWLGIKFDNTVKLSDMEKVELALKNLRDKNVEITERYNLARAELEFTKREVDNAEKAIARIEKAKEKLRMEYDVAVASGDKVRISHIENNATVLQSNLEGAQANLKLRVETIAIQTKAVSRFETLQAQTKIKLNEVNQLKSQLEIKESFTKTMKKYGDYAIENGVEDLEEALRNIDINFNAANFKFEDLENDKSLDEVLNDIEGKSSAISWLTE